MDAELIPGVTAGHALLFVAIGLIFRFLRRVPVIYVAARLPGTFAHELLHYLVGWLLGAKPVSLSIRPYRTVAGRLIYGRVEFARLRWWNEVPVGLAPLLLIPLAAWLFLLSCLAPPSAFICPVLMILAWQCLLSCMPSLRDWFHIVSGTVVIAIVTVLFLIVLELIGVPHV